MELDSRVGLRVGKAGELRSGLSGWLRGSPPARSLPRPMWASLAIIYLTFLCYHMAEHISLSLAITCLSTLTFLCYHMPEHISPSLLSHA